MRPLNLLDKFESMQSADLRRWLGRMFVAGTVVLASVIAAYILFFWDHDFKVDSETWGQFGDFVGGTANPVIGLLTLYAFIFTLLLQNRQLQLTASELETSRKEIELTLVELQRAAKAQERSEVALTAQASSAEQAAKLNTLNFLTSSYRAELETLKTEAFLSIDPRSQRPGIVQERLRILELIVDGLFIEVTENARQEHTKA